MKFTPSDSNRVPQNSSYIAHNNWFEVIKADKVSVDIVSKQTIKSRGAKS